jgi:retinol dehydrogenase-14
VPSFNARRNCLITGATSGIGRETALALAGMNFNLFLVRRNDRQGEKIVAKLRRRFPDGAFAFVRADLSRRDDVLSLVNQASTFFEQIDVLINNAGARIDEYRHNDQGIELTFAANHLGHFMLTCLLLDRIERSPHARVITVGSGAHLGVAARGDWHLRRENYDRRLAYGKSKLANIMFAYELARRAAGTTIRSNAVDPGLVATNFARNNGLYAWFRHLVSHGVRRQLISARRGAETLIYLAASPAIAQTTGKYFYCNREVPSSEASYDEREARRLWAESIELTGLRAYPIRNQALLAS